MKIFYVGFLPYGSTSVERCQDVAALGHQVHAHDMMRCAEGANRIELSLMGRYQWGPRMDRANKAVLEDAHGRDFDMVWVDKGTWLYPEVLRELRQQSNRRLAVHYTPDAQLLDNRTRHYVNAIPVYDLHVTTKPFEVEPLKKLGARKVMLGLQGYGAKFANATPDIARAEMKSDTCFIGHSQSSYRKLAAAVADTGLDFKIWGPKWPRWAKLMPRFRACVQGSGLWGDDYPAALLSTKVALGFLSKYIPETTTTRTFEIPATGAFMLAERTTDHLALFEEGKEAEFFGSIEELRDKVRYFVANDEARQRIARAGRARCQRSGYSLENQLSQVLARLESR
jgi:spore maturation protein CgeB